MATAHLSFNGSGRKILSRHLDAMGNDPTAISKREAYTAWLNAIDAEASAVQAQIDVFNIRLSSPYVKQENSICGTFFDVKS